MPFATTNQNEKDAFLTLLFTYIFLAECAETTLRSGFIHPITSKCYTFAYLFKVLKHEELMALIAVL